MRLDKFLSNMGLGSRRDVHKLIASGAVEVDGSVVTARDAQLDPERQRVCVDGQYVPYKPYVCLMVNKPAGFLSSTEDGSGPVVTDLLDGAYASYKLGVAGRLDKDAVGLLLLTNDGEYIHRVISPEKAVYKRYFAFLRAPVTDADVQAFRAGIRLRDGTVYKRAELTPVELSDLLAAADADDFAETGVEPAGGAVVAIREGKFHQVKKMFIARGNEVLFLKRLSIGGLVLDPGLAPGEFRELTPEEAQAVFANAPAQ